MLLFFNLIYSVFVIYICINDVLKSMPPGDSNSNEVYSFMIFPNLNLVHEAYYTV